jgi:hypothetical protein
MSTLANHDAKVDRLLGIYKIEGAKLIPDGFNGDELRIFRRKQAGSKPIEYLMFTRDGVGVKFLSSMYPDGDGFTIELNKVYYTLVLNGSTASITRKL